MRRFFSCLVFFASASALIDIAAFEEKPWLEDFLSLYLDSSYSYSRFRKVQNAIQQPRHASNNNLLTFDLGFCPFDGWDVQAEAEFAQTPRQSWGRRSVGMQGRARWLDDIAGDPISLTTGLSIRQVAHVSVRDISSPYAARWDFEVHSAIGKEWSHGPWWYMRFFGVGALGQGSRGSPWTRARLVLEGNREDTHQISLFTQGYWGFGRQREVDVNHFHGWGRIDHSSVDLGAGYRFVTAVWGYLWVEYGYRVYARSYPESVNTIQIGYHLPFTFFN